MRKLWLGIILFFACDLLLWQVLFFTFFKNDDFGLYFLDVGQGDSELIVLPGDVQVLIDGGLPNGKVLQELHSVLGSKDRYIDLLVLTHPQTDHFGGLIDVLDRYEVGAIIGSGRGSTLSSYRAFEEMRKEKRVPYVVVRKGDAIRYGEAVLSILSPDEALVRNEEVNESTVVVRLDYGALSALYTGDIGAPAETALVKSKSIDVDVLKVPHHGSRFSSSKEFLKAVSPKIAVIEVGKNTYGHPTPAALGRLKDAGAEIFRTDKNGRVEISKKDESMEIFFEKREAVLR